VNILGNVDDRSAPLGYRFNDSVAAPLHFFVLHDWTHSFFDSLALIEIARSAKKKAEIHESGRPKIMRTFIATMEE